MQIFVLSSTFVAVHRLARFASPPSPLVIAEAIECDFRTPKKLTVTATIRNASTSTQRVQLARLAATLKVPGGPPPSEAHRYWIELVKPTLEPRRPLAPGETARLTASSPDDQFIESALLQLESWRNEAGAAECDIAVQGANGKLLRDFVKLDSVYIDASASQRSSLKSENFESFEESPGR